MSSAIKTSAAIKEGPEKVYGRQDPSNSMLRGSYNLSFDKILVGTVDVFHVGLYSAIVSPDGAANGIKYICFIGALNLTSGFGYSDDTVLREGDKVIFVAPRDANSYGMILAKKPNVFAKDSTHPVKVKSRTGLDRRTHFFSNAGYRKDIMAYTDPVKNKRDPSTVVFTSQRATDRLPGESGTLNQHHCGVLGGIYSTTIAGGGAHIRLSALENRIRIIADSIVECTMVGNLNSWHNRRYLSTERSECMYQEERLGVSSQLEQAFDKADYDKEFYFTKNKTKRQTLKPRILDHSGYYGNLESKYCLRPDPDSFGKIRSMDDRPSDPGVLRESIDPSGQYRLASTGMIGIERIGRIPVPVRINYPWQSEVKAPEATTLKEFKHNEKKPFYRQLELADRVAYDLRNSYARTDEGKDEFSVPDEDDLASKVKDVYDPGFTNSKTVLLEKYDKRRSGIWQGEDGSIILRDAWGSEIVMIGGNIQLSCAGNVQILPGKSALTLAGDDIINKAQKSVDITASSNDVRVSALRNVQVMAGADDNHPGGITLEACGASGPWDATASDGGEGIMTTGVVIKAASGSIVTDSDNLFLRSRSVTGLTSGRDDEVGGENDGKIMVSAHGVFTYGDTICSTTDRSSLLLSGETGALLGDGSAILAGGDSGGVFSGEDFHVPLTMASTGKDIARIINEKLQPIRDQLDQERSNVFFYKSDDLDKMYFKFRSSEECGTTSSWEINGEKDYFTMYEPFWSQVKTKFETLKGIDTTSFDDHHDLWTGERNAPWPGIEVKTSAMYAELPDGPVNMTDEGFNVKRSEVSDRSQISEVPLSEGYKIRR